LSTLVNGADETIATLEQSTMSPPPDTPGQELPDERDPVL
jgi:hypothetical protein